MRTRHILRMQQGHCSIEAGFVLSDLLTDLERTSDHCSNIAGCVIDARAHNLNLHETLRQAKTADGTSSRRTNPTWKSTSFLFRRQTCKKRGACERPIFAIFLLVKRPFPCYTTVIRLFPRKLSILRGRKG